MSLNFFQTVKQAIMHLNPHEIREEAERPVALALYAANDASFRQMESFFAPPALSTARRAELSKVIYRAWTASSDLVPATGREIRIYSRELAAPKGAYTFYPENPDHVVNSILRDHLDLAVPLARHIHPFRAPAAEHLVKKISKENALFSLASAIPDIIPFLALPWAIGEFASDTAVLTANQIRLAFLLAAASNREVGYREQKGEIASILMGAFGWRALARELVGKIPFGGGLLPKAAIAYAATRVAGMSLERYYRIGYGYTREERRVAYEESFARGKSIAGAMLSRIQHRQIAH